MDPALAGELGEASASPISSVPLASLDLRFFFRIALSKEVMLPGLAHFSVVPYAQS